MPIGYGKTQNAVYDWMKESRSVVGWASSVKVGKAFGKSTKWAYRVLASLEDAKRIYATTSKHPVHWAIIEGKDSP